MFYKKSMLIGIVCVLTACAAMQRACAKSVYAVAGHLNSRVKAYLIDANDIIYQATIDNTQSFGAGATGFCLWPSKDRMFITYEADGGMIAWASLKTLSRNPVTDKYAPGVGQLAGIAVSEPDSLLYAMKRGSNQLYAYSYDEVKNKLTPVPLAAGSDYVELQGVAGGMDIALDEEGSAPAGRLYVSSFFSDEIRYYNVSTWAFEGSITLGRPATGIGLDKAGGYLYAGFYTGTEGQNYLMRYDLDGDPCDPETYLEKNMGAPVMDIAVNEDTGYIYMTLKRPTTGNRLGVVEAYDPTGWVSTDPCSLIFLDQETDDDFSGDGPAGIAIGPQYKPPNMFITKVDDIGDCDPCDPCCVLCVVPGDFIVYDICYRSGPEDEYNVVVTDYLPLGCEFESADPCANGYYTPWPSHTYTWEIGFVPGCDPCDPNEPHQCLELTVLVNDRADPFGRLKNVVEIESDDSYAKAKEYTSVCCWDDPCSVSGVIYVNAALEPNVPGGSWNTGVNWENAYIDLQSALHRAGECGCEVWVAREIYSPGGNTTNSFEIPDNVEVYGGFKGNETSREQRDFIRYETILTGKRINDEVVTMGDETVLDGFIVEKGDRRGIYGNGSDFTVRNCSIIGSSEYGIYSKDGDVTVSWCVIKENGLDGIRHRDGGFSIRVENCKVYNNGRNGIHSLYSFPTIINSMIYENGSGGDDYYGIELYQPSNTPDIRNNTIVHNENEGICLTGGNAPDIHNCILWHNNRDNGFGQMDNCSAEYSCITNPNDPNGLLPGASMPDQYGNITCDPCFAYSHPKYGYYHLDPASHCVDRGDNSVVDPCGIGEYDIDGDNRIINGGGGLIVDMGADEVACDDVSNPVDWTADGIVNLHEFYFISAAWLTEDPCAPWQPTDPNLIDNWDSRCDLDDDYVVDIADFVLFCDEWLWQACWRLSAQGTWMCSSSGGGDSGRTIADQSSLARTTPAGLKRRKPPMLSERIEVTEELLNDGTKIEFYAYSTGEPLARRVIDPRGNATHFILYLNNGHRVELNCTYDSMGNETSAIYTHYDSDGNIILVERMEDDMLL